MATRKTREIREALTKKGFVAEQRDHTYLFLHVEGRKSSIRTKISHGEKDYGDNLLSLVARQLHLSSKELNDLIDCPLTHEEYLAILKAKNFLML